MDPRYKTAAFLVGLEIYDRQLKGELVYYSRLVQILDGRLTIKEVSRAIDMLNDLSMIRERSHDYAPWQNHRGKWYHIINLTDVAVEFYCRVNTAISD